MKIDRRGVLGGTVALAVAPFGTTMAATRGAVRNHIVMEDGRVWIAASIKDKPYLFVVDTGAFISLIDEGFAQSLRLNSMEGFKSIAGVGGVSQRSWYNAGEVKLASGIRFPNMLFAGIRQRPSPDAVGTFGAGLFTTYDSDLDFAKGEWRAYPEGRENFDGLVRLKSRFTTGGGGSLIVAEASVDGFTGDFVLDTGSSGEVSLDSRASAKSGLWNDARPYAPVRSRGIGPGSVPGRLVRGGRMKIGRFVFERPLVKLSAPGAESFREDGIIGLTTLGRLNLTTDVSKGVLWAAPNEQPVVEERYPLSGLWLEQTGQRVIVRDVGTGSPAAAAGLREGDVLLGELPMLIARISGRAGKEVTVTLDRGGTHQDVRFTLAAYL
jgi:hypothetical protein